MRSPLNSRTLLQMTIHSFLSSLPSLSRIYYTYIKEINFITPFVGVALNLGCAKKNEEISYLIPRNYRYILRCHRKGRKLRTTFPGDAFVLLYEPNPIRCHSMSCASFRNDVQIPLCRQRILRRNPFLTIHLIEESINLKGNIGRRIIDIILQLTRGVES